MLIDERIEELTEKGAKKILRRAVEEIAGRLSCETCAMRIVCGREASEGDCMWQVLGMLTVPRQDETDEDEAIAEEQDEGIVRYDPETMRVVD